MLFVLHESNRLPGIGPCPEYQQDLDRKSDHTHGEQFVFCLVKINRLRYMDEYEEAEQHKNNEVSRQFLVFITQ